MYCGICEDNQFLNIHSSSLPSKACRMTDPDP